MARLRALGVALVLVLSSVGCEDEPEPDIPDPTPSSTAPSSSETESSPTTSPTAEVEDPVDATRRWVDAINNALLNGSTDELRAFAADGCVGCNNIPDGIDDVVEAGGRFEGGQWTLADGGAQLRKDTAKVTLGVRIAAGQTIPSEGAEPVTYEADSRAITIKMRLSGQTWLFTSVVFLS